MEVPSPIHRAEKISNLFIAVIEKLVTEKALESGESEHITASQLQALRFLSGYEAPLMGEVAHGLRISLPAATKAIDRLVKKSLVGREEDPSDRRVVRIRLTQKGRELVNKVTDQRTSRLEHIMDAMSSEDKAHLVRGMEGFVRSAIVDESIITELCLHCGEDHSDDCLIKDELMRLRGAEPILQTGA